MALLLFSFFALTVLASAQQSKLVTPKAVELKEIKSKLDRDLLPGGTKNLVIEDKQSFHLIIQKAKRLTVVPVHFEAPPDTGGDYASNDCGVYLLTPDGKVSFIRTLGDDLPIQCWSIDSVRLARFGEEYPRIVLSGSLTGGHRAWQQPFVLSWDSYAKKYTMETVNLE